MVQFFDYGITPYSKKLTMKKTKILLLGAILSLLFTACLKDNEDILALLKEIKTQNSELREQVLSLQRTADSLSSLIVATNKQTIALDKKVDSVQAQLALLLGQITTLNAQMMEFNVDIKDIKQKIAELQAKCAELVGLLSQLTGQVVVTNGLIAHYPFTGNAIDSTGNGYNGVVAGASLTTDRFGKANRAYQFNINQQITVPNSTSLNTFPITISLWYNTDTLYKGMSANVFSKYVAASWNGYQILMGDFGNVQNFNGFENNGYGVTPWYLRSYTDRIIGYYNEPPFLQQNITAKTWYHYVFTVDSNGAKIYVNGKLVDSDTWTGQSGACANGYAWKIGGAYDGKWFQGKIDDIRIYTRVLTLDEVQTLATY